MLNNKPQFVLNSGSSAGHSFNPLKTLGAKKTVGKQEVKQEGNQESSLESTPEMQEGLSTEIKQGSQALSVDTAITGIITEKQATTIPRQEEIISPGAPIRYIKPASVESKFSLESYIAGVSGSDSPENVIETIHNNSALPGQSDPAADRSEAGARAEVSAMAGLDQLPDDFQSGQLAHIEEDSSEKKLLLSEGVSGISSDGSKFVGTEMTEDVPVGILGQASLRHVDDEYCIDFLLSLLEIFGRDSKVLNGMNLSLESSLDRDSPLLQRVAQSWKQTLMFLSADEIDRGMSLCRVGAVSQIPNIPSFVSLCRKSREPRASFNVAASCAGKMAYAVSAKEKNEIGWNDKVIFHAARRFGIESLRQSNFETSVHVRKEWEACLREAEGLERAGVLEEIPNYVQEEIDDVCSKGDGVSQIAEIKSIAEQQVSAEDPMFWAVNILRKGRNSNAASREIALRALSRAKRVDMVKLLKCEGIDLTEDSEGIYCLD